MSGKKSRGIWNLLTRTAVEKAADALVKAGLPVSDISVLLPETLGGPKDIERKRLLGTEKATKAPEGAAAGVTTGGVIGGTLGPCWQVLLLAIPGLAIYSRRFPSWPGSQGWRWRSSGRSYRHLDWDGYP